MRFAFFGDVVGRTGRRAVQKHLPRLREDLSLDAVVINGENASGGFGISEKTATEMFDAGADVITLGNHTFDNNAILSYIEREPRLIRPINYPQDVTPGKGANLFQIGDYNLLVINALGRVFMEAMDNPFPAVQEALEACPLGMVADAVLVDFHAEATSEKNAMGHLCDGLASLVVGTHQHVPSADARILSGGTAYQSDAGMCGDYSGVIGMQKEEPMTRFTTGRRSGRFIVGTGEATLCGVFVETNAQTGLAERIEPIRVGPHLKQTIPEV